MDFSSGHPGQLINARRAFGLSALVAVALLLPFAQPSIAAAQTEFSIVGRGHGHGIGMSQWGAQGYAKDRGWTYKRILSHYYQKTRVATAPVSLIVKVNLDRDASARTRWKIRSGSSGRGLVLVDSSDAMSRAKLATDVPYWITVSGGNVRVQADARNSSGTSVPGAVIKTFTGGAYATTGGSSYLIQMLSASGPFSGTGIRWRGNIWFTPTGTSSATAVNRVGMEQYLYGVVPRESPASFAPEALKAQAVAARSYAYTSASKGQTLYCTVQSQVYNGHSSDSDVHEDPRTNQAVNATRARVVMYGSEVVRTYFSSSSGGHTANVEDVWVASDPKPYYVGVPDADGPYPNGTSWGAAIKLNGGQLAARMRSYDYGNNKLYDYSVPAPASVTAVSVERADSGFVRYVRMRWSNGSVFKIRGTTFQSALVLKSTKYFIGAQYPPPLTTKRYQETDARIAYGPGWNVSSSSALLGGTQIWSASAGASCTVAFKGSGLKWIGNKAPSYGRANVYVDGSFDRTVDLYSARTLYRRALWSVGGLSALTTHTVEIRVLGTRNASSRGNAVAIDAFDTSDGSLVAAPQPTSVYQETDTRIAYAGDWQKGSNAAYSGGAHAYSDATGARTVVAFTGREVRWLGTLSPPYGSARVSIDGGPFATVNLRAATTRYQQAVWSKRGLPMRLHTLIIEVARPASSDLAGPISVDAIQVVGGGLQQARLPWLRIEESAPGLAWTGPWKSGTSKVLSGGTYRSASSSAARVTFFFSGTSVRWIGNRAPAYGKASVSIDGGRAVTLDLYAARPLYRQVLFGRSGLANGRHTLTVRVLGASRAGAKGTFVGVDAFDVAGVGRTP